MLEKNASGTLINIAQGQLMTSIVNALYRDSVYAGSVCNTKILNNTGIINVNNAIRQTTGVYTFAKLDIKFSDLDFLFVAFWTNSIILLAVESEYFFVVLTLIKCSLFIKPLTTKSPTLTYRGMLSPVNAEVFNIVLPSTTSPSIGIFSWGLITMISPIFTSSGLTFSTAPFLSTLAKSEFISSRLLKLSLLLSTE